MYYNIASTQNQDKYLTTKEQIMANTPNQPTQPTSGNSSSSEEKKEELDPKVKEAFELAAKQLGIKVGFSGVYVYVDKECPVGTEEQIDKAKKECDDVVPAKDVKKEKPKDPKPKDPKPEDPKPEEYDNEFDP